MNVSMHDSFNLSWKLSLTLRSLALPSLLATYESERRQIAQELLDFDFGHTNAFAAGDAAALAQNLDANIHFISGVGAEYALNVLNRDVAGNPQQRGPGRLRAGALLPPARAERYIDANPVHLQLDIPLLCQFRIYFFAASVHASAGFLERLCGFIASESSVLGRATRAAEASYAAMPAPRTEADEYLLPERYTASSRLFTPALVTSMPKKNVEISDLPPLLRRCPWTFYLDGGSSGAGGCTEKWLGGLAKGEVVLVNVRPDGYVGSMGRWDPGQEAAAEAWLDDYYGGFLRS
jgi:phenol 2-monooxygenase (NADPH)